LMVYMIEILKIIINNIENNIENNMQICWKELKIK
jgi:hypothetical protein